MTAGDKVVVKPLDQLADGARVKVDSEVATAAHERQPHVNAADTSAAPAGPASATSSKSYRRGGQVVPVLHDITLDVARGRLPRR